MTVRDIVFVVTLNRLSKDFAEKEFNQQYDIDNLGRSFASFSVFLESNKNYAKLLTVGKLCLLSYLGIGYGYLGFVN